MNRTYFVLFGVLGFFQGSECVYRASDIGAGSPLRHTLGCKSQKGFFGKGLRGP